MKEEFKELFKNLKMKKLIKLEHEVNYSDLISKIIFNEKITGKELLFRIQLVSQFEGSCAETMLPIVTNEHSVDRLCLFYILFYVTSNWDKILKKATKFYGLKKKELEIKERIKNELDNKDNRKIN